MSSKTLLVGAGAVGLSYGWYLARAGCDVAYLVKPKYADELAGGATLYFPKKRGVRDPQAFPCGAGGYRVLTTNSEVEREAWDYALICVSATALRGDWALRPSSARIYF
ncbi:MAG TPA: 2-dehydropantoate 2-reductase N-terminal domain-containing protein, partial [Myxococcota bacterium]|nr:2-dehydropantoate 2-reductase N-terminal domain-containing protein [Myxococcota bacterium]